jgi:Na+/H+ antiporter NhaD/arsenite permease-like protein
MTIALIIFLASYAVIAFQSIPRLHITRPAGALLGAVAMVVCGVLSLDAAYRAVDMNTIVFLMGAMIIVAYLEISGFLGMVRSLTLRQARTPSQLLALVIASSGLMSAVFMNDTICLLFTPLVLKTARELGLNPVPYLIALAASANVGSACTIIGNPQNMLIAVNSGIGFLAFLSALWPVSLLGLGTVYLVVSLAYRKDLARRTFEPRPEINLPRLRSGMFLASAATVILFLALLVLDYPPPLAAGGCAALLIIAGSRRPRAALQKVDWELLLFFSGLFVIVAGIAEAGLTERAFGHFQKLLHGGRLEQLAWLTGFSTVLSNLASNVPAVMLFLKFIPGLDNPRLYWLALAVSSTLAGNLTVIGSVANIIVFEQSRREVRIGFWEYFRCGLPLTLITLVLGILVLTATVR